MTTMLIMVMVVGDCIIIIVIKIIDLASQAFKNIFISKFGEGTWHAVPNDKFHNKSM